MISARFVITSNHLPGMDARLRAEDNRIRRRGAFQIIARATPRTPVDTGALRNNTIADETGVYWLQEYAADQNFGTVRGVTPKLFATQSAAEVIPLMIDEYKTIGWRLV